MCVHRGECAHVVSACVCTVFLKKNSVLFTHEFVSFFSVCWSNLILIFLTDRCHYTLFFSLFFLNLFRTIYIRF
jgi:hypothetical protein